MDKASTENAEQRPRAPPTAHDVPLRDSAPPIARPIDHAHHSRHPSATNGPDRLSNDVWTSAISRLQAQVSYNTGMLESHRRQFTDIETAITRLHQEMNSMLGMVNEVRAEVRARPPTTETTRHDPAELDILTGQLQRLTNKVNEIDGLGLQMDMMKSRMKRLEEGPPNAAASHPTPSSSRREPPHGREAPPPPPAMPHGQQAQHHPAQGPPPSAQHPPLPPMRTGSMPSPETNRPPSFPPPHLRDPQGGPGHRPSSESRPFSVDHHSASHPPPGPAPGYRPNEPLPPPSAISGWRPADQYPSSGVSPANAPSVPRPHGMEPDSHNGHTSGWAAVNTNAAIKRPPEEARSPYESPLGDSSKRPKLAPLMPNMPRSNYGDESFGPSHPPFHSTGTPNHSDSSQQPRSRAPSDGSQPPSHPTPASTLQHSFRFITSTQQADSQESWRPESQREAPPHGHGRGGRSGRGRGRGRGGRGRGGSHHGGHHEAQETGGTPEWEKTEWSGSQVSPNGYYNPMQHPHSPNLATRGGIVRRADAHMIGPVERQHEFPATPIQTPLGEPYGPHDSNHTGSGKKTRTKPIRNSEGILIRKDGRPDMRSVSSANNLRKVHAKKEAERAEMEEDGDGMTRSGTPISAAAGENDESDEPAENTQERHREIMNRLFAHGQGGLEGGRAAERFFPGHDETIQGPGRQMKMERDSEMDSRSREESSQATDVVMKEASEAQAEERPLEHQVANKVETEARPPHEHVGVGGENVSVHA